MGTVVDVHKRFWSHVNKTDTCWLWTACTSGGGYGRFNSETGQVQAHRWSYEQWHGPIPAGLVIDHLCRVPRCVNPAHLEAVPQRINVLRGTSIMAQNAAKQFCKNGHEFNIQNTHITVANERACRPCATLSKQRQRARRLASTEPRTANRTDHQ